MIMITYYLNDSWNHEYHFCNYLIITYDYDYLLS